MDVEVQKEFENQLSNQKNTSFVEDVFLPVLRSAFGFPTKQLSASPEDYTRLYLLGKRQSIMPIIWQGLRNYNCPQETMNQFDRARLADIGQHVILEDATQNLSTIFEMAQIPYIPLKGSVINRYYPHPWMRTRCDIDILIHESDLERAIQLVEEKTDLVRGIRGFHDVPLHNNRLNVEIHFSIKEDSDGVDRILCKAWDYSRKCDDGSRYCFSPAFQAFHVVAHMARHIKHGVVGMRSILDLWVLRKQFNSIDDEVRDLCRQSGLLTFYNCCCDLIDSWMEGKEKTTDAEKLEGYCLGIDEEYKYSLTTAAVLRENSGFRYLKRRLFRGRNSLQEMYPGLRKRPYLLPYYQVKRWGRLVNSRKRRAIRKELEGVNRIDNDKVLRYDQFLRDLGL